MRKNTNANKTQFVFMKEQARLNDYLNDVERWIFHNYKNGLAAMENAETSLEIVKEQFLANYRDQMMEEGQ